MKIYLPTKKILQLIIIGAFSIISLVILLTCCYHYQKSERLIHRLETVLNSPQLPGDIEFMPLPSMTDDLDDIKQMKAYIFSKKAMISFYVYLPAAGFTLFFSFLLAIMSEYYSNSKRSKLSKAIINGIDSVPLVFWVFLALGITYKFITNPSWYCEHLKWAYYPVLNISYCSVLIVIFYTQDVRKIAEIKASNIIYGEMVTGIKDRQIIGRLFKYQFVKTIFIKQFFYVIIYLLLFDYCFMYIYKAHRQIGNSFTTLAFNAGLYFSRYEELRLKGLDLMASIYLELHDACFYFIIFIVVVFYAILFWFFDIKVLSND